MQELKRGVLVTFEGIDGCGKTTLATNLKQRLETKFKTILTKQSGGTLAGKQIHTLVQNPPSPLAPKAEYLLFAADRAQHVAELIAPALKDQTLVLCDRMADSSVIYQGYARGLDLQMIEQINAWAMESIVPDITFYVKISPNVALERRTHRTGIPSTFETEKRAFMKKVAAGYEHYFTGKERVITLDGTSTQSELTAQAYEIILTLFAHNGLIL